MRLTLAVLALGLLSPLINLAQASVPGTGCSISVVGNNNKSSVTCVGLDRQSAEEIRDMVNMTKGNAVELHELSSELSSIRKELGKKSEPILGLLFYAEIVLPSDNTDVKAYMAYLDSTIQRLLPSVKPNTATEYEGVYFFFGSDGKPSAVVINPHSPHYPALSHYEPLGNAISYGFGVAFGGPKPGALLKMSVNDRGTRRLKYDTAERTLVIEYNQSSPDARSWQNSGDFVNVSDLERSDVMVGLSRNIDETMDRNLRSKAIIQGAWFCWFGITTPLGRRFTAERRSIHRVDKSAEGDSYFGGSFQDLFRPEWQPLMFEQRYWPDADTVVALDATVTKFETELAANGLTAPPKAIEVHIDANAKEVSFGPEEVTLPPNPKNLQTAVLMSAAVDRIDSDTELTDNIAGYLVADFLNSPQLEVDGLSVDISVGLAKAGEDPDPVRLAKGLWRLRQTAGAATTNKVVGSALRKFKETQGAGDAQMRFASMMKTAATPPTAAKMKSIWAEYGLEK